MTDGILKLCYISDQCAYFTTQSLEDQWGDDWNDAPYEHNAGTPYAWRGDRESPEPEYALRHLYFEGPFEQPCSWGTNSSYSVEMINRGAVPWLQTDRYNKTTDRIRIFAGTTYGEFKELVKKAGGTVYVDETTVYREGAT